MKNALETTLCTTGTTLTISGTPKHRTLLSASSFARTGQENAYSGPGTRIMGGATSRVGSWMVRSMTKI